MIKRMLLLIFLFSFSFINVKALDSVSISNIILKEKSENTLDDLKIDDNTIKNDIYFNDVDSDRALINNFRNVMIYYY